MSTAGVSNSAVQDTSNKILYAGDSSNIVAKAGSSKSNTDLSSCMESSINLNPGVHVIAVWWEDQNAKLQWYLGNIVHAVDIVH